MLNVRLQNKLLNKVQNFKYLGSHITSDGSVDYEIKHRIQSGWRNWKNTSGVLCDKSISAKKRPAMLYGAAFVESRPIKKTQEKKLEVAEMRMLRLIYGVKKYDRLRNEKIRGTTISQKIQEK
jgi:hypothetical protein